MWLSGFGVFKQCFAAFMLSREGKCIKNIGKTRCENSTLLDERMRSARIFGIDRPRYSEDFTIEIEREVCGDEGAAFFRRLDDDGTK